MHTFHNLLLYIGLVVTIFKNVFPGMATLLLAFIGTVHMKNPLFGRGYPLPAIVDSIKHKKFDSDPDPEKKPGSETLVDSDTYLIAISSWVLSNPLTVW